MKTKPKSSKKGGAQQKRVGRLAAPAKSPDMLLNKGKRTKVKLEDIIAPPRYNQGLRYGAPGLRYYVADVTTPVNDGGKVALNLSSRTDSNFLAFTDNHIALVTADPLFPAADILPPAPAFLALRNDFATKLAACEAAKVAYREATLLKDTARAALADAFTVVRAPFVQLTTNGNTAAIVATGLPVKSVPGPAPALEPPQNLRIDLDGTEGLMLATWLAAAGAIGYLIQYSLADTAARNWVTVNSTNRKASFANMEVGKLYAFRVATIGTGSAQSLWSAEVLRMAA